MSVRYIITPPDMPQDGAFRLAYPLYGAMPHSFIPVSALGGDTYNLSLAEAADVQEIRDWCVEQFGPPCSHQRRDARWYEAGYDFHFREAKDAFAFRMRWC